MLTSLALIFLTGLLLASLFEKLKLPRIIGMLLAGILLGPYVLNLLDDSVLSISSDLRQMALIIILIKAGLSLNLSDLKKVGRPAILMSFVPATFEIIGYVLLAPTLLGISKIEAAVMGSVLAAVSPAVVIPRMVQLMETNYGTEKSIPQLIMAGASCDDIFVIVLFSTFSSMAQGGSANIIDFVNIPVSILLGIVIGAIIGYLLALFFETCHRQGHSIRSSLKVLILLSLAFLCMALENRLKGIVAISGLLAVVSMACVVKLKSPIDVTNRLSLKFGKLWIAAEILLFVLVGAAVDIRYTMQAGAGAVLLIALALAVCLAIGVCFLTAKQETLSYGLSAGTYVMDEADAVQILPSRVTFRMSGSRQEFVFMLSPLSSYYMAGEYTINDSVVTCSDGLYTLVFKIKDNDTIVLQIPNQDGLHMSGLFIPNGTEFHYEEPSRGTLTFHTEPASANAMRADFSLDFGETIDYSEVWAEYWQDGMCTKSEPLALHREDGQLHLSFQVQNGDGENAPTVQVSMQGETSDAVLTKFALPDTMTGYLFKSYDDGQELYPLDGDTYVLAALAPDLGDGVRQVDCIDLSMEPALYEQAACMVLVRAAFGSDEFPHG